MSTSISITRMSEPETIRVRVEVEGERIDLDVELQDFARCITGRGDAPATLRRRIDLRNARRTYVADGCFLRWKDNPDEQGFLFAEAATQRDAERIVEEFNTEPHFETFRAQRCADPLGKAVTEQLHPNG